VLVGTRHTASSLSPAPVAVYDNDQADDVALNDDNTEPEFLSALESSVASGRDTAHRVQPDIATYTIPRRGRSLQMQYRFWRTLFFAARLFASILWWQFVMPRLIGREAVKRRNPARWLRYTRRFRAFAIIMGGVMIKLGQFVSTRNDVLPPEITQELSGLQDEVPSVPQKQINAAIERELGSISDRFRWIAPEPVAAASLGQVYRAQLLNGDRVVVKVQRPNIRDIVYTDLAALRIVAWVANKFQFIRRRADTAALAEEFGRVLLEEVSYRKEAENAARFAEMFKDDMGVYIPAIYIEHSTDSILTIEDVTTIKISDYDAMEAAGISRTAVAKRLMDTYLRMVFEERFFHADPHPGNLFVYPLPYENGTNKGNRPFYLIFVDFGMTGSLSPQIAAGLINTLTAIVTRDAEKLVKSYGELGFLLPDADTERIEEATKAAFDQVWGLSMSDIKNVSYTEARELGREFNDLLFAMPFQVPQDFIYLGRAMGILSGMATSLDPNFNPWSELQPYAQKMIAKSITGAEGTALGFPILQSLFNGDAPGTILEAARMLLGRAIALPQRADSVLNQLDRGELTVRVTPTKAYREPLARIEAQGRRTSRAVIFAGLLVSSTLLYTNGDVIPAVIGWGLSAIALVSAWWVGD
jgi:predicted unusual protein kinase regulating ubiquinone biosynthesis (AarF/ABC1/UbiB family)